ncbi:MAG TPA: DUF1028 domain-containing protein [Pyrinomonadaceae bacterium]|jgi:uncharacterized Ntn-hydrolase superfamily protein|nr:DUF1028 domain-containing protein [Pyrinomonadaceae bacterium]
MKSKQLLVLVVISLSLLFSDPAMATWSITAVDPKTKEVGIAGASCTDFVFGIAGVAPGKGVIVAQAMSNMAAKRQGVKMLLEGASPQAVIAAITDPDFDLNFSLQQYGVVALGFENKPATYTGVDTDGWRGVAHGYGVSIQGNTLTDARVVNDALAAFEAAAKDNRMSLADRLMAALEAGAVNGGDNRCGRQKARSAFIIVAKPTDDIKASYLRINIPGQEEGGSNPIKLLRIKYDAWRKSI